MNKYTLFSILAATAFWGCENPATDQGNKGVSLTKQKIIHTLSGSYFSGEKDPSEEAKVNVVGAAVYRTGYFEETAAVEVELEIDKQYTERLLAVPEDLTEEEAAEAEIVKDCVLLPDDCYQIGELNLTVPAGKLWTSVSVALDKERIARLDAFRKYVLPAFSIRRSDLEVRGSVKHCFSVVEIVKEYPPLPDDLTGWVNLTQNPGVKVSTPCKVWSDAKLHKVEWVIDGDKDYETDSNRWVPNIKDGNQPAPELVIDLAGTYRIDGFKLYYCVNTNVRPDCDFFIREPGSETWKKIAELRGNTENTPSYTFAGEQATHVRVLWTKKTSSNSADAVKLKEIEIYQKN